MYPAVLPSLRCPVCRRALTASQRTLRCPHGHNFDLARQGYVDLSGGRVTHAGDTAEMVAARQAMLAAGHLDVVTEAVTAALAEAMPGRPDAESDRYPKDLVVEVGAGTGHHLARILDARPDLVGLAVDLSKAALRRAARAHPRLAAIRADVWRDLPIADRAAAAVLDVFAPRSGAQFHRILRPEGALVVVTPGAGHLAELVGPLRLLSIDPAKDDRLSATLGPWFRRVNERAWTRPLRLSRAEASALVRMGPSAWHLEAAELAGRLATRHEPLPATVSIVVSTWRPRVPGSGPTRKPRGPA